MNALLVNEKGEVKPPRKKKKLKQKLNYGKWEKSFFRLRNS